MSQSYWNSEKSNGEKQQLFRHSMRLERIGLMVAVFLAPYSLMVPAQAADWGYDSDYADDKVVDPKFGQQKSNRTPKNIAPTRPPDDDINDGAQAPVEELDAAPAALNPPKGQKPAAKPSSAAKPAAKPGAKPGVKPAANVKPGTRPAAKPAPNAEFDSTADIEAGADEGTMSGQSSDSADDAVTEERDPVYREGITRPVSVPVDQPKKIITAWLNLFGLVSPVAGPGELPKGPDYSSQLTDEQKKRFTATLKKLLSGKEQAGYKQIDSYWSALARLLQDTDHRSNYRVLFRSLLSMRADAKDIGEEERSMLHEALGPKRIAEIGPPPLTEDAIEAYTDMTCFLYEQSHAGKTVDAGDNRALFAMIVRDKFKKAPTDKDRMAMNQFPLSWAKFRILYTDANPSEKVLLAERIASEQGTRGLNIRNAMLEEVLSSQVWRRFVVGSNKVMVTSNADGSGGNSAGGNSAKSNAVKQKARTTGSALKTGLGTGALEKRMESLSRDLHSEEKAGSPAKKYEQNPAASTAKPKRNY
ncbi:MAG: hypothetical protein SGJ27_30700 [Candidatus Melainabacteria bacterium]|nr:hypothetical protein [Candidatus Melainabacteria bacterium]